MLKDGIYLQEISIYSMYTSYFSDQDLCLSQLSAFFNHTHKCTTHLCRAFNTQLGRIAEACWAMSFPTRILKHKHQIKQHV